MEITEFSDNAVKIGNRVLPAVNVQVEGFPTFVKFENPIVDIGHILPIYFELLFETGALWTVTYHGEDILVEMYVDFDNEPELSIAKLYKTWDELLDAYKKAAY